MDKKDLLGNPDIYPSDDILAEALGESYTAYKSLVQKLPEYKIEPEWRYYNDGKSWLTKAVYKKKTVFWLSVWDGFFKVSLFFTEKTRIGIQELPISATIKTKIANEPAMGRVIPLTLELYSESILEDLYALIAYKQSLK